MELKLYIVQVMKLLLGNIQSTGQWTGCHYQDAVASICLFA